MTAAGGAPLPPRRGELRIVGTSATSEIELMLDRVADSVRPHAPRVLQIGSRSSVSDRNEPNWRALIAKRFGSRCQFIGVDLAEGSNVDQRLDICAPPRVIAQTLGVGSFDLVVCCHVLEHTRSPWKAARNVATILKPGGLAYVATPWSQAFHAAPDDYWRFSMRGLQILFDGLEVISSFYSGGDVGLDIAYRIERDGHPCLEAGAGGVEQGLFQLVLDHEDNRAVLARQATQRLPVSRTYLPTLFVNLVMRKLLK